MTQDQTLNSLPPYLSDIITRHTCTAPLCPGCWGTNNEQDSFWNSRNVVAAFHFLMGCRAEQVISFTVLNQVTDGKLRLKPATKPRLPSKIVIDPGLGLKMPPVESTAPLRSPLCGAAPDSL